MSHGRRTIFLLASMLACSLMLLTAAGAGAATSPATTVLQPSAAAASPDEEVGTTPAETPIDFSVALALGDQAGAEALERSVSDPASPDYRHYLTAAQWEKRFSPSQASVSAARSWLESQGVTVEAVTADRMTIQASASAATVQKAFGTQLKQYRRLGRVLRLSATPLNVPSSLASTIVGVTGVDQNLATPDKLTGGEPHRAAQPAAKEIPQPPGFRNAQPCSSYYGEKNDTTDPAYGGGYPSPLPYAPCGYVPAQLQGAYGLSSQIAKGIDGKGVTVAVVDAYASPTLFADANQYSQKNQPTQVLAAGQYSQHVSKTFNNVALCEASEWFGEQTLDVEAVHATAPGANILYVGAKNCVNGLYDSVQEVVDGHLADVITNSWGDDGGDVLDSAGSRRGFDNILLMAGGTGIGVQFSSGDEGDNFSDLGLVVADYPAGSPYATSVGGTSLQVSSAATRAGEVGWSTSKSTLCSTLLLQERFPGCKSAGKLNTWRPAAPGEYVYGGGGGTSYVYAQPWYQQGVVPAALAGRNSKTTGVANRVEPDISMDADPTTGMLVGETQQFPEGTHYDEYRIGGTSLSSPLFAGVMADADQANGVALGFVNPRLYKLGSSPSAAGAYYDVVPGAPQALVRVDYLNELNAEEGTITSARTLEYEGKVTFCRRPGKCAKQPVSLNTAPGFDSMTGLGTPSDELVGDLAKP
jgi:subtilase family serine protease